MEPTAEPSKPRPSLSAAPAFNLAETIADSPRWTYLADGTQSTVYEDEASRQYVLKVMKPPAEVVAKYASYGLNDLSQLSWVLRRFPQYQRAPPATGASGGTAQPEALSPEQVAKDSLEVAALITRMNVASYVLAWENFRDETLLCHLQTEPIRPAVETALGLAVTLVNQAAEARVLRLDEHAWYVQRKVTLLSDKLDELVKEQRQGSGTATHMQEPKRVLDLWISCQEHFWTRGYFDFDVMNPGANYGVLLDSDGWVECVVCVDVGELHHSDEVEEQLQEQQRGEGAGANQCNIYGGGLVAELAKKRVIEPRQFFAKHLIELGLYDYFCEQVNIRYDAFRNGMLAACFTRLR